MFAMMSVLFASCDEDAYDREDAFVTVTVTEGGEYASIYPLVIIHFSTIISTPFFPSGITHPRLHELIRRNNTILSHCSKRTLDCWVSIETFIIFAFPSDSVEYKLGTRYAESHIGTLETTTPVAQTIFNVHFGIFRILGSHNRYFISGYFGFNHHHVFFGNCNRKSPFFTLQQ